MSFESQRVTRSYTQKIEASAEKIFPLLCPQKELDWLDGWNYEMVYSITGFAEEGAIFKTKHEGDINTIWVVSKYDRENKIIEFVRMTWEIVVVKIHIHVLDNNNGTSDVYIEYTFTSITEKGNEFVEGTSEKQFNKMMRWWEKSMNYYFETGRKLLMFDSKRSKMETQKKGKKLFSKGK
jgi:hypothetical protein